jgi:hypothetical protein
VKPTPAPVTPAEEAEAVAAEEEAEAVEMELARVTARAEATKDTTKSASMVLQAIEAERSAVLDELDLEDAGRPA